MSTERTSTGQTSAVRMSAGAVGTEPVSTDQ